MPEITVEVSDGYRKHRKEEPWRGHWEFTKNGKFYSRTGKYRERPEEKSLMKEAEKFYATA